MESKAKILIIDDEENIRWVMKKGLEKKHFIVDTVANGEQALQKIRDEEYLLVFSDIFLEGMSGLELLKQLQTEAPELKVVVMAAQDSMNNTIEAMRNGAFDYLSKPFDFDEVYSLVERAIAAQVSPSPESTSGEMEPGDALVDAIIGKSREMQDVFKIIGKSAGSDLPVLITGESGTGKEMVARALHYYSARSDQPFICINCAAIARELLESELFGHERGAFTGAVDSKQGKFELANGGTLFLDEIANIPVAQQAKLLRVLEAGEFERLGSSRTRRVDVRIVSATNQDLIAAHTAGGFREDLYYRLAETVFEIPPLRDRDEDCLPIARHVLEEGAETHGRTIQGFTKEALGAILAYPWPGNVRELRNVLERAAVLATGSEITEADLQLEAPGEAVLTATPGIELSFADAKRQTVETFERHYLREALRENEGNVSRTAGAIGMVRQSLQQKIRELGLKADEFRRRARD